MEQELRLVAADSPHAQQHVHPIKRRREKAQQYSDMIYFPSKWIEIWPLDSDKLATRLLVLHSSYVPGLLSRESNTY